MVWYIVYWCLAQTQGLSRGAKEAMAPPEQKFFEPAFKKWPFFVSKKEESEKNFQPRLKARRKYCLYTVRKNEKSAKKKLEDLAPPEIFPATPLALPKP